MQFRIYDRNLAEFPVTVDIYEKYARVVDYGEYPLSEVVIDRPYVQNVFSKNYKKLDLKKYIL